MYFSLYVTYRGFSTEVHFVSVKRFRDLVISIILKAKLKLINEESITGNILFHHNVAFFTVKGASVTSTVRTVIEG